MKKKNLIVIALASTALAIGGGVVLASSMSAKAVEVKADSIEVYLRGSMNSWNWGASDANKFVVTTEPGYEYELKGIKINAGDEWKIADSSWGSHNYGWGKLNFYGNNSYFSEKENGGGNVKTDVGGTYDFYIRENGSELDIRVVNESVEPVAITQWKIIGSFNNWTEDATQISMTLSEGYYTATVDFATDVQFKIRGNNNWDYALGGAWASKINDASILTTIGMDNAKVVYAGTFTFRISQDVTDQLIAGGSIDHYIQITYTAKTLADKVYVTHPADFGDTLYAYAWTGDSKNATWPGVPMTLVCKNELDQDVYAVSGLSAFKNIIINDGGTHQTVDGNSGAFNWNDACWIEKSGNDYVFGYYTFDADKAALIDWAEGFIGAEDLCNGTGDEWSKFVTSYTALDPAAKAFFTTAEVTADEDGNVLEQAAYRYEWGVTVKNQTAFAESQRPKTGFQANYSAALKLSHGSSQGEVTTAIAVTATIGVGAAVGMVFIRRRRVL